MTTHDKFPKSFQVLAALALTSIGHIPSALADNPPPCDPCRLDLPPAADPTHVKAIEVKAEKAGLKGWAVSVTWNTIDVPHGAYTPECANVNHQGLQAFDGWYVPLPNPVPPPKIFYMNSGTTRFAMSDNFYARYFDPCKGGPYKSGGSTYNTIKVKAPTPPPTDPPPPDDPPPNDPPGGGGDPPIQPPGGDPNDGGEESHEPCPQGPFVPQQCSPFQHPDTRVAATLPAPTQVEIVAENISFNHSKNGILQYTYDPATVSIPKYFLQEHVETTLSGGNPESPVGGSITWKICQMTGELIITQKEGNPSWYGVRSGANVTLTETTASGSFDVSGYDDCPNQVNDTPAVMMFASQLADEYTKERMRDDAFSHAWEFKGEGFYKQQEPFAKLLINSSEEKVEYAKTKYKIRVPDYLPRPYYVNWVEEFTPEDSNPNDDQVPEKQYITKSATINGNESGVYTIDPRRNPEKEGVWRVQLLMLDAFVDYNRDLNISFDGSDQTSPSKPHRFWVNDDRDMRHVVDPDSPPVGHSGIYEEDDVEPNEKSLADCDDGRLSYLRDLEDLDRIHVDYTPIANKMMALAMSGESIMIKARLEDMEGSPSLNLFTAVEVDGGREYLVGTIDDDTNGNYPHDGIPGQQILGDFGVSLGTVSSGGEIVVTDYNKSAREDGNYRMALLYEGKTPGKGNLYFDVYVGGLKWGSSNPIHLDLKPVRKLYETWTVGHDIPAGVQYTEWPVITQEPVGDWEIPEPGTLEERNYTLLVHGWNCSRFDKEVLFADTQYKRLWQLGYKGRFGSFTWPCFWGYDAISIADLEQKLAHFNGSEERAWNSANGLKKLLENLNARGFSIRVNAHSQGNIVCAEALRLFNGASPVRRYISQMAALNAHAWDSSVPKIFFDGTVPDVYSKYWEPGLSSTNVLEWNNSAISKAYHNNAYHNAYHSNSTRYINHFNVEDWALEWAEINSMQKPAAGYFYYETPNSQYGSLNRASPGKEMHFPQDRYEAFAWIVEWKAKPTGAEGATEGCFDKRDSFDMTTMFGDQHPGHSAPWRSTIQRRFEYWGRFIRDMAYEK